RLHAVALADFRHCPCAFSENPGCECLSIDDLVIGSSDCIVHSDFPPANRQYRHCLASDAASSFSDVEGRPRDIVESTGSSCLSVGAAASTSSLSCSELL
ncbi:MAG TPA: hypothetical protein VHH53_11985, partial [Pseudonocardiaceae bacterium]|nr:hypothetical protein [Pseudonocardiaceae bacterium]